MPANFSFARETFTFWATETVTDHGEYFCKIEQRPFGSSLFIRDLGFAGSAHKHWPCMPWSYCSFEVYDCEGKMMYKGEPQTMESFVEPGKQVLAYRFMSADGSYIGRTSELPTLLIRMGGIAERKDSSLYVLDTGDRQVLKLAKDPNQLYWITHWHGMINAPGVHGFADVRSVPMADPLFVAFLLSMQFRMKGVFGPVVAFFLLVLLALAVAFGVATWKDSPRDMQLCGRQFCGKVEEEEMDLAHLLPDQPTGGCCAGNRAR